MEKINIAELLKDCPKGMELYSPLFGNCNFVKVQDYEDQIMVKLETGATVTFKSDGRYYDYPNAECILFPSKEKTTWKGFQIPFKDGDIVTGNNYACSYITIFREKELIDNISFSYHACLTSFGDFRVNNVADDTNLRLATEEEKQKLFDAIKANGYHWNAETKTLEKLINKNKFVIGATVTNGKIKGKICSRDVDSYKLEDGNYIFFNEVHNWELVPNKFDVINFEPFMKVLVRNDNSDIWECDFFSSYNPKCSNRFHCVGAWYDICIPYIGNEHLLGTTDDCDEYFKTWE